MIFQDLEFHNVAELQQVDQVQGLRLQRFPESVRHSLGHRDHERGRFYAERSVGCEIRFVTDAPFFRITLSAVENEGIVFIYKGSFLHSSHKLQAGLPTTLHIEEPPKFVEVEPSALKSPSFSPRVWRVLFGYESCFAFHYLETFGHTVRPPTSDEIPKFKWLAYGSSITFGGNAILYTNTYVQQAAKRLGIDVFCKGMPGSCFIDPLMIQYLSEETGWDLVTLELGVNMRGRFSSEEFEERVRQLIGNILKNHPGKPVVVINIYPNSANYLKNQNNLITIDNRNFNETVKNVCRELDCENLHFIEGTEILKDLSGLTTDLLHPSDDGHIMMGENLANRMREIFDLK